MESKDLVKNVENRNALRQVFAVYDCFPRMDKVRRHSVFYWYEQFENPLNSNWNCLQQLPKKALLWRAKEGPYDEHKECGSYPGLRKKVEKVIQKKIAIRFKCWMNDKQCLYMQQNKKMLSFYEKKLRNNDILKRLKKYENTLSWVGQHCKQKTY